ncbi:MAG TPA: tRNA preQ1(34) S-adenosylmethionine ribosyltransferase-isomerase QueA [Candidatus Paceibacterota bacterium]|nr:tRNA preQ1(34) S-adenosylmethionine ribosyltransferase-isomerase QueA [Candidatus Paceibacterota bacterium]
MEQYAYDLPPELIAQAPAEPRDAARLLVYDTATDEIVTDRFWNLAKYLPAQAVLVLNRTKVVPARLTMHKSTGGKVTALFLVNEPIPNEPRAVKALVDRRLAPGEALYFSTGEAAVVLRQEENIFIIGLPFERAGLFHYLDQHGTTPIPPYIKNTPLSEKKLRVEYQTVFARERGSAAAPTASLHFTPRVFRALERQKVAREFLTLHVGLGTFAPVREENIRARRLHEEYFSIEPRAASAISAAKNEARPIVAVGTTVVRALESAALRSGKNLFLRSGEQRTTAFIYPPHDFLVPDALITNFHVPRSSLLMLVDAFLQHKKARRHLLDLYVFARREKLRFFSFGDAMLVR